MTQKVSNTLRNFITSNNAFCAALKQDQIELDNNILLELIIYYLTLNKNVINMLPEQDRKLINELINKQNFYINNNHIVVGETPISLSYLRQIVLELENQIKPSLRGRIMYFQDLSTKDLKMRSTRYTPSSKLRVIPIEEGKKNTYYTLVSREIEYERTTKVNPRTKPYIKESKDNAKCSIKFLLYILGECSNSYISNIVFNFALSTFNIACSVIVS